MFGAIYGDVIGSYYESRCTKDYDFPFTKESTFTDDTVLTVAVCKAILNNPEPISRFQIRRRAFEYAAQYKQYYSYYPRAGFGNMFSAWARSGSFRTVHSYGNGAAMRAVPIGYAYDSIEQILLQVKASCYCTHRNREAIKGAGAVAVALTAFFDSHDYESAVRNAVSLGGDADTEACIAGGIAEAYYGEIPKAISDFCNSRVDLSLRQVVNEFRERFAL